MNPKVQALIAAAREKHAARIAAAQQSLQQTSAATPLAMPLSAPLGTNSGIANDPSSGTQFNPEQLTAISYALQAKNFCLIGAAGTGKTTVTQEIIKRLQRSSHVLPLSTSTKHLNAQAPGIVVCGYTNKAVNNIKKKLPQHLQGHCLTIHKLIEFAPVYYEILDPETGLTKNTMRFEPSYNGANKLPHISTVVCEESSMIGTDLFGQLLDALPRPDATQFIFLGDLNQIPPVFGPSILGFKLAELLTVELVHVYRQALLSPIISLATAVRTESLSDIPNLTQTLTIDAEEHGVVHFQPWKKRVDFEDATLMMKSFIPRIISSGQYNPEQDMILMPFNKKFGTIEINKIIADYLSKQRKATVFEVIARYQASYWAVGDRVMVDRHEAVIKSISVTIGYQGKVPQTESIHLDRWGINSETHTPANDKKSVDELMNLLADSGSVSSDEAKNLASHTITVYIPELDIEKTLNTAGEINTMTFGYALSIHKSQGSEWERVFLFLHNSHATMMSRELIYTAVTRAKNSLFIVCEADAKPYQSSIRIASQRPRIPGTTLREKIDFFAKKAKEMLSPSTTASQNSLNAETNEE